MNGVRMGQVVGHRAGEVRVDLDLNRGTGWQGRPLVAGRSAAADRPPAAELVHEHAFTVAGAGEPVISFRAPLDVEDGRWAVLRIVDREQNVDKRAPAAYTGSGGAIAYAAPFFLDPDVAPAPLSAKRKEKAKGRPRS